MLAREVPWVGVVAGRSPGELGSYLSPNSVGPSLFGGGQVWWSLLAPQVAGSRPRDLRVARRRPPRLPRTSRKASSGCRPVHVSLPSLPFHTHPQAMLNRQRGRWPSSTLAQRPWKKEQQHQHHVESSKSIAHHWVVPKDRRKGHHWILSWIQRKRATVTELATPQDLADVVQGVGSLALPRHDAGTQRHLLEPVGRGREPCPCE
jgi:hypothetical protein